MKAIFGVIGDIPEDHIYSMGIQMNHRGANIYTEKIATGIKFGVSSTEPTAKILKKNNCAIISDGTLYNKTDIAQYLKNSFRISSTDTVEELIFDLYKKKGTEGLGLINGDFAFAIWDSNSEKLILGRDMFGCHPLYYRRINSRLLLFSTEYKSLLKTSGDDPEPDLDMIQHLQNCKKLPLGKTLFKNVYSVKPGTVIIFNKDGNPTNELYLPRIKSDVKQMSELEAVEMIQKELIKAIRRRIEDPKKIGISLSGGIDSIGIAFICRKFFPKAEIHTFTAGYGRDDFEINTATEVSNSINAHHHIIKTSPNVLKDNLHRLVWHLEDPYARSESLQLYLIGQKACEYVNVLLCGMEADALFEGMPRHKLLYIMKKWSIFKKYLEEIYNFTQIGVNPNSMLGKALKKAYFRNKIPDVPKIIGTQYTPEKITLPQIDDEFINKFLSKGFQAGSSQDGQKLERTFAAWGVDFRSPFLDKNLVNAAYQISDSHKIKNGIQKYILRLSLKSIVPEKFIFVPKKPQKMRYDLAFSEQLDKMVEEYLTTKKVKSRKFFHMKDIKDLQERKSNMPYSDERAMRLWTILLTEIWAQLFIDNNKSELLM